MQISPKLITFGGGALAAGVGVGAAIAADKLIANTGNQKQTTGGIAAGLGVAAGVGAALARHTKAVGPLAGLGVGLAAAGVFDALRAGGDSPTLPTGGTPPPARTDGLKDGDLLPDGVQAKPEDIYHSGDEIRFDSVVGNQGASPLELALHFNETKGTSRTTQVIFNEDGTASERDLQGGLRLDERRDHSHLHFDDFVYFQLYKADANGKPKMENELAGGVKQSFYITDIQKYDVKDQKNLDAANALKNKGQLDRGIVSADAVQGISVGMADVYGAGLEGQSFHVPDIAPGRYVLRQAFDPSDEVLEQDERNNVTDTVFEVKRDGSIKTVSADFAPAADYTTLEDGRIVIPSVVSSLANARDGHDHGAEEEAGHVHGVDDDHSVLGPPVPPQNHGLDF